MFPSKVLMSLTVIGWAAVDASPVGRSTGQAILRFATSIHKEGTLNIAEKDRARAKALRNVAYLGKRAISTSVANNGSAYTAQVGVGNPPTNYTLLVDTGSSNTWIGASAPYTPTNSSNDTGNTVFVSYGSGFFFGEEWTDTVTLGPGLVITNQSIGVANSTFGFDHFDGILGVGPVDLTSGTVSNTNTVSTVSDNLLAQGTIFEEVLGVYYVPASEPNNTGKLTFGGYDSSVITSEVNYVRLTTTSPASRYWGIDQSITYGNTSILDTTAGIVDTGTTLIMIATDAYRKYQNLTGGVIDNITGLLSITSSQYSNLQTLTFMVGGVSYGLSPNAQLWPRSLNSAIGGNPNSIYLVVSDIGSSSGSGLDFVNGFTFLERFYSVYDTTNGLVGFASTAYTDATTN